MKPRMSSLEFDKGRRGCSGVGQLAVEELRGGSCGWQSWVLASEAAY